MILIINKNHQSKLFKQLKMCANVEACRDLTIEINKRDGTLTICGDSSAEEYELSNLSDVVSKLINQAIYEEILGRLYNKDYRLMIERIAQDNAPIPSFLHFLNDAGIITEIEELRTKLHGAQNMEEQEEIELFI